MVKMTTKTKYSPPVSEDFDRRKTQLDLEDYLDKKGIDELFLQITESVLLEKPDNVVKFISNFLMNNYPAQMSAIPEEKKLDLSKFWFLLYFAPPTHTLHSQNYCYYLFVAHFLLQALMIDPKEMLRHTDDSESDDNDDVEVNERSEKSIQSQNNLTNIEEKHQDDKLEQRRFAESGETHTDVVCPPLISTTQRIID
jgi:hypothetical protein